MSVTIAEYGATITSIRQPDRDGDRAEITLGPRDLAEAEASKAFLGSTVGRYANRIANARFDLDGQRFTLPANDGQNILHGGPEGFANQLWTGSLAGDGVRFDLVSPEGDQGFPGEISAHVSFALADADLVISYEATTSAPTVLNLTNHTYFNLSGVTRSGFDSDGTDPTVAQHELTVKAEAYLPVDATGIPMGEPEPVGDTPMDFRVATLLADRLTSSFPQIAQFGGIDHTFVHPQAVVLHHPRSGRTLQVETSKPGVQIYTGNSLASAGHITHGAIAIETQYWPNSPNRPTFPSCVLRPGEVYRHTTTLRFS